MLLTDEGKKQCGHCKAVLLAPDFSRNRGAPDGLDNTCKRCRAEYLRRYVSNPVVKERLTDYHREYSATHRNQLNLRRIRKSYGLEPEEYSRLVDKQGGMCRCCGVAKKLYIDHVHGTDIVRGLCCNECNLGIGLLGDNSDGVRNALKYLEPTIPFIEEASI